MNVEQKSEDLLPEQAPSLAEIVSAAETLAAARRLLRGTGWARVEERRGRKRVVVHPPYITPRERTLLSEDAAEKIHHAAEVLTWAVNHSLPFVSLEIPDDHLGLSLTITFERC